MNYAQGMMEPIQWLVQVLSALTNVQVNVERFTKLMETESDVRDTPEVVEKYGDSFHPKKKNWEPLYGDIEFRDVTFRYPDGQENILEHFNLKVPQGTNVAMPAMPMTIIEASRGNRSINACMSSISRLPSAFSTAPTSWNSMDLLTAWKISRKIAAHTVSCIPTPAQAVISPRLEMVE